VNDCSLEQSVTYSTRNDNILDLIFNTYPILTQISVVPGMSDHEAVLFSVNVKDCIPDNITEHSIYLYHKGNIDAIKNDAMDLSNTFLSSDPYRRTVEENGNYSRRIYKIVFQKMFLKKSLESRIAYHG